MENIDDYHTEGTISICGPTSVELFHQLTLSPLLTGRKPEKIGICLTPPSSGWQGLSKLDWATEWLMG
jgi:hypothetical protein